MSLKTFTLISALERSQLNDVKNNLQISCLEVCGKNLYLGTEDGHIIHYLVEERQTNQGVSTKLECTKQGQALVELHKSVSHIKASTVLKRVLTLSDSSIQMVNMLNMQPLSGFKIKFVSVFAVNERPQKKDPFCIEVCVGTKKKSIQIFSIKDDQSFLLKEFQLDSTPAALKVNGSVMCVGLSRDYRMIGCDAGSQQDLFEFDPVQVRPMVVHIAKNEYVLSASNALGIFAFSDGASRRPPLQWINNIISVSFVRPYVVVLNDEFMTVHSILDQQQKQTIQFTGGITTSESNDRIFVATKYDVYCLILEPIDRQIQSLLTERRITEALDLTKSINKGSAISQDLDEMVRRIELQAGFVEFCRMNFDDASTHFTNGGLDPRELVSLYPDMLPKSSKFKRSNPPLHDINSIADLPGMGQEQIDKYEHFLFSHLRPIYPHVHHELKSDIMTAYLKLLGKLHPSNLTSDLQKFQDFVDVDSCIEYFKKHSDYHWSAILLCSSGKKEEAVETWRRMCDGELKDASFPGFSFIIEILCKIDDSSLVWKHSDWFMEKDQKLAVKIFVDQCDRLGVDNIVEYLKEYKEACAMFLEDLIHSKKSTDEKYHSMLALLYLDEVLLLKELRNDDPDELERTRQKLCHFLKTSNSYKVSTLLPRIEGTDLYHECALLYGKMEDHRTALNILAEKVQSFEAAEDYCMVYSQGKPASHRMNLFEILLGIYLNAKNFKEHYSTPALTLLHNHRHEFDAVKVIQALPNNWSNDVIREFLVDSLRSSLHRLRTSTIEVMLNRGTNCSTRLDSMFHAKKPVIVSDDRVCFLCNRPFTDPVFVSLPRQDVIVHVQCQQNLM